MWAMLRRTMNKIIKLMIIMLWAHVEPGNPMVASSSPAVANDPTWCAKHFTIIMSL